MASFPAILVLAISRTYEFVPHPNRWDSHSTLSVIDTVLRFWLTAPAHLMEALGRACHRGVFLKLVGRCFAKGVVDFAQTGRAKFWGMVEKLDKKRQVAFPVFS